MKKILIFTIVFFIFMETKSSRYDAYVIFPIIQNLPYDLKIGKDPVTSYNPFTLILSSEDLFLLPNYEYKFVGDESVYITKRILKYALLDDRIFLEVKTYKGEIIYFIIESKNQKHLIETKEGGKRRLGEGVYTILTEDTFSNIDLELDWYDLENVPWMYEFWDVFGYLYFVALLAGVYFVLKKKKDNPPTRPRL